MTELKDWITKLKTEKPELNDFITKLEGFISDNGFNTTQFERAIDKGLQLKEEEVKKTFIKNVESKEDNN
jgi:hypothetical protein